LLSVIRKSSFLSLSPAQRVGGDIIRAEGGIIRQSSTSNIPATTYICGLGRRDRSPPLAAAGFGLGNLHEKATIEAGAGLA